MRLATPFAVFALTLLVLATPALHAQTTPDPNPAASYYPLAVGNVWEYRDYDTKTPLPQRYPFERVTVTGQTTLAGRTYFTVVRQQFRRSGGAWDEQRDETLVRFDTLAATARRAVNGGADEDDVLLCRLDLPVPDSSAFVPCEDSEFLTYNVVPGATLQIGGDLVETTIRSERLLYFTRRFAAGIGYLGVEGCEGSCTDTRLEYARVGGVTYGAPIADIPLGPDPTPAEAYAPLAVGNRWEYRLVNLDGFRGFRRSTVVRDTIIDGVTWKILRQESFINPTTQTSVAESLVRFDPVTANLTYRAPTGSTQPAYFCRLDVDLTGDGTGLCSGNVTYTKRTQTAPPGVTTTVLTLPTAFGETQVAAGLGLVFSAIEGSETTLVFARIDGETFGTPVAGEVDAAPMAAFALTAAPNPTAGPLSLALTLPAAQTVAVEAFDVLGRRVWQQRAALGAGPQTVAVDASAWAPGVYVVRATAGRVAATARVVRR